MLRFGWNPFAGAGGYRVWQAEGDLAGPYPNVYNQPASGSGVQKHPRTVPGTKPGERFFGLVSASVGGYSNADETALLPA